MTWRQQPMVLVLWEIQYALVLESGLVQYNDVSQA